MKFWSRSLVGAVSSFIVWAAHFGIVYALVGVGCAEGWHRTSLAGINALTMLLIGLTLPALALIGWIGRGGWHAYTEAKGYQANRDDRARLRFMGMVTVAVAALAFVATLMTSVPIAMLPPCE